MIGLPLQLMIFLSVSCLVGGVGLLIYENVLRGRLAYRARLRELLGDDQQEQAAGLFKAGLFRSDDSQQHFDAASGSPLVRMRRLLASSGWENHTGRFVAISAALGGAGLLSGWAVTWQLMLAAPLAVLAPTLVLYFRWLAKRRRLLRQLPHAFEMISRAVRAGQTVPAAIQIIAEDFDAPIADEFSRCRDQQNLGVSRENAFRQMAQRTRVMELEIFVVALLVQARSGGDLAQLLDNLASMVRKRLRMQKRVRALTGEARMQAGILIALPIAALLAITLLSPDYVGVLYQRPWLLGAAAGGQIIGAVWIRRIVSFAS